ncbi:ATP-binding protein [Nocardia carnea]|uniref:AAA family ATPase n=1 Tax=Nocardia carnea TaxID=37328 RepID=A0ABW7THL4_9NOCA
MSDSGSGPDSGTSPTPSPVLIVVSGPPGSGKTTLAHAIAQRLGRHDAGRCHCGCRSRLPTATLGAEPGSPVSGSRYPGRSLHSIDIGNPGPNHPPGRDEPAPAGTRSPGSRSRRADRSCAALRSPAFGNRKQRSA